MTRIYYSEDGYLQLLSDVIDYGFDVPDDRTGVGRRKIFGVTWTHDLRDSFCAFTHRANNPVFMGMKELWFFFSGSTQTKDLEEVGVTFWQGNTTREFLDKRGLEHLPEGCYGKAYGFQLRNFNGHLAVDESRRVSSHGGVDQLYQLYQNLLKDPYGSRHVVTMWNPMQLNEMALPPCWHTHQFLVEPSPIGDILHLQVTGRSCDLMFGTPMNVSQYAFYLAAMAELLGMTAGNLTANMIDAHLYFNQIEYARETCTREFNDMPQIKFKKKIETFDDFLGLRAEDIELEGYNLNRTPYVEKRPPMAV